MAANESTAQRVTRGARHAGREVAPWVVVLGRFGCVAKGIVYGIVGVLALQAALGLGGDTTDSRGVLEHVLDAPLGPLLLGLTAFGLVGYALWRFVEAALDPENKGTEAKGLLTRSGYLLSGVVYAALAFYALRLLRGAGAAAGGGEQQYQDLTAQALALPLGPLLVGLAGLVVVGNACFQLYRAFTADFRDELDTSRMSGTEVTWAVRIGRLGFAARGVVFGIIGFFLLQAARQVEPEQTRGTGGALAILADSPLGPWLLSVVALGLLAYGVHMLVEARYRRMAVC